MRKILVTGANGFLGCYLLKQLLEKNYIILATGKGPARIPFSNENLTYEPAELGSEEQVEKLVRQFQPDVIIHAGAMSKPDDCENNKEAAWNINAKGTEYLLQNASAFKSQFIFISTDFVFDGTKGMYSETDVPSPINYYGQTKLHAEELVKKYPGVWKIVRTVMVYGRPFQNRQNLVSACAAALMKGEAVTIYDDQFRTPTFVEDLASGIIALIGKRVSGIYHLSGKDEMTLYEMILKVARYLNADENLVIPITEKDRYQAARRPMKTGFNISKARSEIGYDPVSFETGIEKTFSAQSISQY